MNASVLPSGEMRKKPRSGWRKKSRTGIGGASAAFATEGRAKAKVPNVIMTQSAAQQGWFGMEFSRNSMAASQPFVVERADCTPGVYCSLSSRHHERRERCAHVGGHGRGTAGGAVDPHMDEVAGRRRLVVAAAERADLAGHPPVSKPTDAQ